MSEDADQDLLGRGGRGTIAVSIDVFRCRQRASVQLAVDGQRYCVDHHHGGRHHVGRKVLSQVSSSLAGIEEPRRRLGHVADESLLARAVLASDDDSLFHAVQISQCDLDFAEFDPVAADLDLLIGAAEILHLPITAPAHQIAGPVHPRPRAAERASDETRCGQLGPPDISHSDATTGHIQLPRNTWRQFPQPAIKDEQCGPGCRRADRNDIRRRRSSFQGCTDRGVHRGLGWPIGVDQHPSRCPTLHQLGRTGFPGHHQRGGLQAVR